MPKPVTKKSGKAAPRSMDFKGMGDSELIQLFEDAFREQVATNCNVQEFSVEVVRSVNSDKIEFEVEITGLAGTPIMDDFKANKIKDARKVLLSRADKGEVALNLVPSRTVFLTGNDYLITYSNK